MKRTLLVLLLITGSIRLNAQQAKPEITLTDGLQNTFKPNAWLAPQVLLQQNNSNNYKGAPRDSVTMYSTMPVAKVMSNDRMPIAGGRNSNMVYTMPVMKVGIVNPLAPIQKRPRP